MPIEPRKRKKGFEGTFTSGLNEGVVISLTVGDRIKRVMELQRGISNEINTSKVGTTQRVLIEEAIEDEWRGRTEFDAPEVDNEVYVRSEKPLTIGSFVDVEIEHSEDFDLFGTAKD